MIYENICKLAKERGISINKLEEKANVSTGSICKWGNSVTRIAIAGADGLMMRATSHRINSNRQLRM